MEEEKDVSLWVPVEVAALKDCLTFKEAAQAVKGAEGCTWKSGKPSGNWVSLAYFQCASHQTCKRSMKLSKYRCGTFLCCMKGEHGAIACEYKRKNSRLTSTQESLLATAIQQGAKPGQVWATWNNEMADAALARGEDPLQGKKAAGDGNAGACK